MIVQVNTNGIISILAGNTTNGYSGDGAAAVNACLAAPVGVAVDTAGAVYFADSQNNVIRQVDTNGVIRTVAGDSGPGYLGDGAAAANGRLMQPQGVCVDGTGNFFIADTGNNVIRAAILEENVTAQNQTLTLTDVTLGNAGNYQVVVFNPSGIVTSAVASLTVTPIPDWWEMKYFGQTGLDPNASYDGTGQTLLYDYLHGVDVPNVISVNRISYGNCYVNVTQVPAQLIIQGLPYCMAVIIDSTNFAAATWTSYTPNFTVDLGSAPTQGYHFVWVGVRGFNDPLWAAQWMEATLVYDTIAPVVTVTNPAAAPLTVTKPYLQVQGYANEEISRLTYAVSNAAGMITNQGFVTGSKYDTNRLDLSTSFFQCYDVPLAVGTNTITLTVSDRAGNLTTNNLNVTLDYTGATNPPAVTLIWPTNGMALSGSSCTIRGTMSDETGTVSAQAVDGSGNTNAVSGLVERNGMFWIENVPLNGTNQISVQLTDAAGNMTTTNFTILPSPFNLTVDSVSDATQPTTSVFGTLDQEVGSVVVNGVTASNILANSDGTWRWQADGVPANGTGTVTFDAVAYSSSGSGSGGGTDSDNLADNSSATANASLEVEEPWQMVIVEHHIYKSGWGSERNGNTTSWDSKSHYSKDYTSAPWSGGALSYQGAIDSYDFSTQTDIGSGTTSTNWTDTQISWSPSDSWQITYEADPGNPITTNSGSTIGMQPSVFAVPDEDLEAYRIGGALW